MSTPSRGFRGRREARADAARLPPGQYLTHDFPVLTYGPTPRTPLNEWTFSIDGRVDAPASWTWEQFSNLPSETVMTDIHCVTKWSKLDTTWEGVAVDTLMRDIEPEAAYVSVWADGDYTTNIPLVDLLGGKAWVVHTFAGRPLAPEHGGPARLLVPHLYFWKSAKWVRGLRLTASDELGFWEVNGYHRYGVPWREQRYEGD